MHLVCKTPIFLQYVGRYPKIYRSTLNAQTLAMAKPGKKKPLNGPNLIIGIFMVDFVLMLYFVLRTNRWSPAGLFFGTSWGLHFTAHFQ